MFALLGTSFARHCHASVNIADRQLLARTETGRASCRAREMGVDERNCVSKFPPPVRGRELLTKGTPSYKFNNDEPPSRREGLPGKQEGLSSWLDSLSEL